MIFNKIKEKFKHYDLREEGAKWVEKNFGSEYVPEFLEKYDNINRGIPVGGFQETIVFLDLIERIKSDT